MEISISECSQYNGNSCTHTRYAFTPTSLHHTLVHSDTLVLSYTHTPIPIHPYTHTPCTLHQDDFPELKRSIRMTFLREGTAVQCIRHTLQ
jgi:hypothetical protein